MSVVRPKALRRHDIASPAPPPVDLGTMHSYAGHDSQRLAQALRHHRSTRHGLDVGLATPWGNTLLHTACASAGASRQVATLLAAGANVHAVGPYGLTPLAAALNAQQWKSAQLVAAAGGKACLGPFNEPSERSLLANIFGIDGVTHLHGQTFELEGAFDFGIYPRLADAVDAFARTHADYRLMPPTLWRQSVQALREAPSNTYLPNHAIHARARAGVPMLLPTGWRGHSVCVAWLGNFAVRANRNQSHPWSRYKTLEPWRFHGACIDRKHLRCLVDNRRRSAWFGKAILLWSDATHRLAKGHALAQACAHLAPKPQKAHNCTVANAKAGLLALWLLLRAHAGIRENAATRKDLWREYKRLTTFVRLYFLERYRSAHAGSLATAAPPDTDLIRRCEAKLTAAGSRHFCLSPLRKTC